MSLYVRTVGQLLQKIKSEDKAAVNAAAMPLTRFVERTLESIEMTSNYCKYNLFCFKTFHGSRLKVVREI